MRTLTVRHLTLAGALAAAATLLVTVSGPAATDQLAQAHLTRDQAAAVTALPAADDARTQALKEIRAQLPATLTPESAAAAVSALATDAGLTWTELRTGPGRQATVHTSVDDVTVTSVTVTAAVTGPDDAVTALLTSIAAAAPLMTVQDVTFHAETGTSRAEVTLAVYAAALEDQ